MYKRIHRTISCIIALRQNRWVIRGKIIFHESQRTSSRPLLSLWNAFKCNCSPYAPFTPRQRRASIIFSRKHTRVINSRCARSSAGLYRAVSGSDERVGNDLIYECKWPLRRSPYRMVHSCPPAAVKYTVRHAHARDSQRMRTGTAQTKKTFYGHDISFVSISYSRLVDNAPLKLFVTTGYSWPFAKL